jgi:hypothetical protein
MLRLLSTLFGLLLVLGLGLSALVLSTRDATPLVAAMPDPSAEGLRWRKARLEARLASGLGGGGDGVIELTGADLDLLALLLAEQFDDARARIRLDEGRAQVTLSAPFPDALGGWLNLDAELVESTQGLRIDRLEAGSLALPPALAALLLRQASRLLDVPDLLSDISLTPGAAALHTRADSGLARGGPLVSLAGRDNGRVLATQRRLYGLVASRPARGPISAAELLSALIASAPGGRDDAAAENRAAILALAAYVNGRSIPDADGAPPPRMIPLQMHGRKDVAQHFLTSAALQVKGGSGLANLIGFAKEFHDAGGSSGFSFRDLAANRAGNRFAELAVGDPDAARRIQALARDGFSDQDLVPRLDWLPGTMSRATFQRDFGGRDGRMYAVLVDEIDRRISALTFTRAAGQMR